MKSVSQLNPEIREREARREDIQKAINRFCKEQYGIENFFALADSFFASIDGFTVCLARQVPTINVEHIACHMLARWLSSVMERKVTTLPLSLTHDRYLGGNSYKKSLVKLPWLARGRKGLLFVNGQRIVLGQPEGLSLGSIKTIEGASLPEYHLALRELAFGPNIVVDLSPFFQKLFEESLNSGKGPETAYQVVAMGSVERLVRAKAGMKNLRPPAEWVYLFHLMLFLDGKRALLSTVGDNDEVNDWFTEAIETIEEIAGISPFIIDTPVSAQTHEYQSNLLEYPRFVLQEGWVANMIMPSLDPSLSVFQAVEDLEKQVISLA